MPTFAISPNQLFNAAKYEIKTMSQAVQYQSPTIREMRTAIGEEKIAGHVTLFLIDLFEFFAVGKSVGEVQVKETAEIIVDTFPDIKISDLAYCFKLAKAGQLTDGKIYDRLDGQVVCLWITDYKNRYADTKTMIQRKDIPKIEPINKEAQMESDAIIQRLKERWAAKAYIRTNDEQIVPQAQKKDTHDEMIQKWMRHFNSIYISRMEDFGLNKGRFIKRNGQIMDIQTFLKHRLNVWNEWNQRNENE